MSHDAAFAAMPIHEDVLRKRLEAEPLPERAVVTMQRSELQRLGSIYPPAIDELERRRKRRDAKDKRDLEALAATAPPKGDASDKELRSLIDRLFAL